MKNNNRPCAARNTYRSRAAAVLHQMHVVIHGRATSYLFSLKRNDAIHFRSLPVSCYIFCFTIFKNGASVWTHKKGRHKMTRIIQLCWCSLVVFTMTSSRVVIAARHPWLALLQTQRLRRPSPDILHRLNRYSPSLISGFPNRVSVNTATVSSSEKHYD